MIPIVTPAEMAEIDAAAPEDVEVLIGRAGWAVTRAARGMLGGCYGKRVVVIAGKGNNGADGRVAGMLLARRGVRVIVVDPAGRGDPDDEPTGTLPEADLIIDAAFGTGLTRPYRAPKPAEPDTAVLAVDIPSGVSGLTGAALGSPLVATRTVTFAALKPGLIIGDGPDHSGVVEVADIGLDTSAAKAWLMTDADVASWLPSRPTNAHKWQSALRLVAGSPGMTGAADLATAGALRAGAGYVRRSTPGTDPVASGWVATGPLEAVATALPSHDWAHEVLSDLERFSALVVGPGLGTDPDLASRLSAILATPLPVVIDGDGLRALGDDPKRVLAARPTGAAPVVLTPHEGEFVRLGGTLEVGGDRFAAVRALARSTGAIVLLKGSTTLVAHPDGRVLAVTSGDARLATAGTGDVLSGVIGAFIARGIPPFQAAAAAAWVHGRAARIGPAEGLIASDLPGLVARVLAGIGHNGVRPRTKGFDDDQT